MRAGGRDEDDVPASAGLDPAADGDAGHFEWVVEIDSEDFVAGVVFVVPEVRRRLKNHRDTDVVSNAAKVFRAVEECDL